VEVLKGPNALLFGRGGAGGVVNRVQKEAGFQPLYQVSFEGGGFDHRRLTIDTDEPLGERVAVRLNGMLESSGSFRSHVGLNRYGVTPALTFTPTASTRIVASYEYLGDSRVADRGIPSYAGRPIDIDPAAYFGNPSDSHVDANVNIGHVIVEHAAGRSVVRNHTTLANYDRRYQNYVPGAVTPDRASATLTAYNNATDRTNFFNQTDLTVQARTSRVTHTLLAGAEFGRQFTDNFRNTGYFDNATTATLVPVAQPTIATPVTFRQSATDADNHVEARVAAAYVQDQAALSTHVQLVGGVRVDRFDLQYHDNRSGARLSRLDTLVSPRAGLVVKPLDAVSLYGSYSMSYVPSSGDQFSSLTVITQQLEPEKLANYEAGAKWDAGRGLALSAAVYRLDRTNTRATDPNDPTRIVQTGSQRTDGFEAGVSGTVIGPWSAAGGYAWQDARVTSATASAAAGARAGQVPRHTFSLWNSYRLAPRWSIGLGLQYRSDMFVAVDNTVTLPGYTRADAAVFHQITSRTRLQLNVENVLNRRYFANADSNTNISPGAPRTLRAALTTRF
jgi:catecholate siderophore receptor